MKLGKFAAPAAALALSAPSVAREKIFVGRPADFAGAAAFGWPGY